MLGETDSPMCFNCGEPAAVRTFVNLSKEYSTWPKDIIKALALIEAGTMPDRTPVQLVFYACEKCDAGASDYLLDTHGTIDGSEHLVPVKPCANPFHDGTGTGVLKATNGQVGMYGCPDCDSFSTRASSNEGDPAYVAMKHAIEQLRS